MLAYPLVRCISRQRTCVDTIQSNRRLTRKKFPSLSCRLLTLRRLILGKRSARGGCEREGGDGCRFLVDPLRGIGANLLERAPGPRRSIGPIKCNDEDAVIATRTITALNFANVRFNSRGIIAR